MIKSINQTIKWLGSIDDNQDGISFCDWIMVTHRKKNAIEMCSTLKMEWEVIRVGRVVRYFQPRLFGKT